MSADHDHDPYSRWPPEFETWPHADQLKHCEMRMTRKGLIAAMLSRSGLDPEQYQLRDDSKLRKKELAAIYLKMEGVANAE
ncbi:hypothetical protein [Halovenus marina]|uniref:hypothetical protein n=1 Tax=Halovenus marina TaxID=3396621 RepID=UPI003F55E766